MKREIVPSCSHSVPTVRIRKPYSLRDVPTVPTVPTQNIMPIHERHTKNINMLCPRAYREFCKKVGTVGTNTANLTATAVLTFPV